MRKVLITVITILIMIQLCACTSDKVNNSSESPKNLNSKTDIENFNKDSEGKHTNLKVFEQNGFMVLDEQSFWVNFKNWGKVRFISGYYQDNGKRVLKFYLIDEKQDILYQFSDLLDNTSWNLFDVRAISFKDVNRDGLDDIIVIAEYATGAGPSGATPFPIAGIYFQKGKEFVRVQKLNEEITDFDSIDMILKFVEGKDIKLNNSTFAH